MDLFGKNALTKVVFAFEQKVVTPLAFRASQKVITSSEDYLINSKIEYLHKKSPGKFVSIPYGIDTDIFYPQKRDPDLVEKYGLKNKKVVLFVGGLDSAHYFKGINHLLGAFSHLDNKKYKLIIVGKGNLRTRYEEMAEELKISKNTIFTGFVSDEDLPKYYNLADICVLPSINSAEAFGMVLLESMACGKPVIASDLPGVRAVTNNGKNGLLCEPGNENDLKEKMERLLTNDSLYCELSQAAINSIKINYDWNRVAKEIIKIYNEALSK